MKYVVSSPPPDDVIVKVLTLLSLDYCIRRQVRRGERLRQRRRQPAARGAGDQPSATGLRRGPAPAAGADAPDGGGPARPGPGNTGRGQQTPNQTQVNNKLTACSFTNIQTNLDKQVLDSKIKAIKEIT